MKKAGVRELKKRISEYLRAVERGEEVIVTKRGKEIALIIPVREGSMGKKVTPLLTEGIASWNGGKPAGLKKRIRVKGEAVSQVILEERR
ncbi:MAG: type II toxin-antitoxin system prevent-host-death family antitoxin [Deltaproteobacteria bacterium]|nr:MAG: type II toxin-antitoxin system prevent-host-death family antitoxin [Deltaproteobacteria bacterium]